MNKDLKIIKGIVNILENYDEEYSEKDIAIIDGLNRIFNANFKTGYDKKGNSYIYPLDDKKDVKYNLVDLLGEEFTDVKGQDAINKVYKERKGHVKNAFYKDKIGYITVCWGDDTCGLKHLEKERIDRKQDPKETIKKLGKAIENGTIFKEEDDRWKIRYKDITVIISKELKNDKAIAIITGYIKNKKS